MFVGWTNVQVAEYTPTRITCNAVILGSLAIIIINGNINTNVKNLFKTSYAALILNKFFTFVFMFPFMFVIRKFPILRAERTMKALCILKMEDGNVTLN